MAGKTSDETDIESPTQPTIIENADEDVVMTEEI
jgi:hypothetical protein